MPSFTFVSTANAYRAPRCNAGVRRHPPDTFNIDERALETAITDRTRAIVVVHYAGVACEMDEIMRIASAHGIAVIEDDAHGFGATYRGRPLGSVRRARDALASTRPRTSTAARAARCSSTTRRLDERAEIVREKGTNRSGSSAGRSTSTRGSTSDRATCPRTCWPRSCARSSTSSTTSRPAG